MLCHFLQYCKKSSQRTSLFKCGNPNLCTWHHQISAQFLLNHVLELPLMSEQNFERTLLHHYHALVVLFSIVEFLGRRYWNQQHYFSAPPIAKCFFIAKYYIITAFESKFTAIHVNSSSIKCCGITDTHGWLVIYYKIRILPTTHCSTFPFSWIA